MVAAASGIVMVGAGVAVTDQLTDYPVLSAQALRYALGAALLYLFAMATGRHEPRLAATDWMRLAAVAATGMALFNVAIVRAVTTGEPAVVGTIVGLAPVGVALTVSVAERRRPRATILTGAVLAAAGAAFVQGFGDADLAALAWSVVALGCEVAFVILSAPLLRTLSPLGLTIRACALASGLLLLAGVMFGGSGSYVRPDVGEMLAIAYLSLGSTALAFVLWYGALARLGAERTGLFAGLMPVSAALVGAMVTSASLKPGTLAGALLAAAGLAVGLAPRSMVL